MTTLIGITTARVSVSGQWTSKMVLPEMYVHAVNRAGGTPVLIHAETPEAEWSQLLARLDGLLLPGGGDIDPALFNGRPHDRIYDIDPARDAIEIGMVRLAAESGVPFMGICRGIQVVNVALGGGLTIDIADQHPGAQRHDWYPGIPREYLAHPVRVKSGTLLASLLEMEQIDVNSLHHQAADTPAPALIAAAWAPDGVLEAVELPGHPFGLGVQWHPEWLVDSRPMARLFEGLVIAAGASKK